MQDHFHTLFLFQSISMLVNPRSTFILEKKNSDTVRWDTGISRLPESCLAYNIKRDPLKKSPRSTKCVIGGLIRHYGLRALMTFSSLLSLEAAELAKYLKISEKFYRVAKGLSFFLFQNIFEYMGMMGTKVFPRW